MQMPCLYGFMVFILLACEAEQNMQERRMIDQTQVNTLPEKNPLKKVSQPDSTPCPSITQVEKAQATTPSFRENGPYHWAQVRSAQALSEREGQHIKVFFPLGTFTLGEMANVTFINPVRDKGQAILILHFSNGQNPVIEGMYQPSAGYGKPFWVTGEIVVKNGANLMGFQTGQAKILNLDQDKICGTFDLQNERGAQATGSFVAKLEKR
ncbi:MAG: hypothetical protein HC913_15215 [Microscillaceae bacterium]|nr:hypothetical protein [Microscillaceae bacterium]